MGNEKTYEVTPVCLMDWRIIELNAKRRTVGFRNIGFDSRLTTRELMPSTTEAEIRARVHAAFHEGGNIYLVDESHTRGKRLRLGLDDLVATVLSLASGRVSAALIERIEKTGSDYHEQCGGG